MVSRSLFLRAIVLAAVVLTLVATTASAANNAAAFSLQPTRVDPSRIAPGGYFVLDTTPGQVIQDEFVVQNNGTASGSARLFAVDSLTGQNSGTIFLSEKDPLQDAGTWIRLDQQEITLSPGERMTVKFTVTVPAGVAPGQYMGGLVALNTMITEGQASGGLQINTQSRAVLAVQINLPGPVVEKLDVTAISTGGRQGNQTVNLTLRNDGTEMVKPQGALVISDASGQEVQRLPLKLDTFLPRTGIDYPVAVQKQALGPGAYHATVDLTYGKSGVTHYEGDFSITAAQVAQVFPSASAAALAAPPIAASATPTASSTTAPAQWVLFAGGAVLLVLALAGGIFLGRRGRSGGVVK
jgi:hypothetical protein